MKPITKILTNPWVYGLVANIPAVLILELFVYKYISFGVFIICTFVYTLVYRPYINLIRLRALGFDKEYSIWQIIFVIGFKHYWKLNTKTAE